MAEAKVRASELGPTRPALPAPSRWERRFTQLTVLSAIVLPPVLLSPGLIRGPTLDASVFMQVAMTVRAGGMPYLDAWDHKPPGIYIVEALVGLTSQVQDPWVAVWMLSWAATTTTLLLLGFGFGPPPSARAGLILVVGAALVCSGYDFALGGGYTETFAILPATAGLVVVANHRRLPGLTLAGALGVAAATISLQLAPAMFAIALLAFRGQGSRGLLFVALGGGLVVLPTAGWLWLGGAAPSALDALAVFNRAYVAGNGWNAWSLAGVVRSTLAAAALLTPALARVAYLVRRPRQTSALDGSALVWLGSAMTFFAVQQNWFPHYGIALVPPLFVLGRNARTSPVGIGLITVAVAGIITALALPPFVAPPSLARLASEVQGLPSTSRIFVWGNEPTIYLASGKAAASKYVYIRPLMTPGYATDAVVGEVLDDWYDDPPDAIIDASFNLFGVSSVPLLGPWRFPGDPVADNLDPLRAFVRERYVVASVIDDWVMYVPR